MRLFLGSQSKSRQNLLKESRIYFEPVQQDLDESQCDWDLPLQKLVESLCVQKMEHVVLPETRKSTDLCLVLTADTLGENSKGEIQAKPKNRQDAINKIKSYRNGATTGTAFCLERRVWNGSIWSTDKRIVGYAQASYIFDVPDNLIEWYLENGFKEQNYLNVSGAVQIEGLGAQFLKNLNGSYTAVLGLPLFEVRQALLSLGLNY